MIWSIKYRANREVSAKFDWRGGVTIWSLELEAREEFHAPFGHLLTQHPGPAGLVRNWHGGAGGRSGNQTAGAATGGVGGLRGCGECDRARDQAGRSCSTFEDSRGGENPVSDCGSQG